MDSRTENHTLAGIDLSSMQIQPAQPGAFLARIADRVLNRPLLLHPGKVDVILSVLQGRIGLEGWGGLTTPDASRFLGSSRRMDGKPGLSNRVGKTAIITIDSSLVNRGAWIGANSGLQSYEGIDAQIREAAGDRDVANILLDIDSPGGEATGMYGLAETIRNVAAEKNVVAFVNDMAASAAYGIASAADEIVVSPTSVVGSIGVVLTHLDRSGELEAKGIRPTLIYAGAHKVDGNSFGPLSDTVRADLQREVETFYDRFVETVAAGRGERLTADMARQTEARVFIGAEAVERGLADRVASLDAVLNELEQQAHAGRKAGTGGMSMSTKEAAPQAVNAGISEADMKAAVDMARAEGAAAERERIAGILGCEAAKGREKQAITMALETDMTAEAAAKVLASFEPAKPAASPADDLAARAAAGPEIGATMNADARSAEADKAAAGWKRAVEAANARFNV